MKRVIISLAAGLLSIMPASALKLTADTTLYINCGNGSDHNGDPTTPQLAFKTAEYAATYMYSKVDVDGWSLWWQFADGICDETNGNGRGVIMAGLVPGQGVQRPGISESEIRWRGNPNNWSAVRFSTNAWPGPFFASTASAVWVEHMQLEARGAGTCTLTAWWTGLLFFNNVVFLDASSGHRCSDTGGYVEARGIYAIAGSAAGHIVAALNGIAYQKPVPVIIVPGLNGSCPHFSSAFLTLVTGGRFANYTSAWINGGCEASGPATIISATGEMVGDGGLPSGLQ